MEHRPMRVSKANAERMQSQKLDKNVVDKKLSDSDILSNYARTLGMSFMSVELLVEMHKTITTGNKENSLKDKMEYKKATDEGFADGFNEVKYILEDLVDSDMSHKDLLTELKKMISSYEEL